MIKKWLKLEWRITILYIFFSGLCKLFSDIFLRRLIHDPKYFENIYLYEGWIFVLLSALLIFFSLRDALNRQRSAVVHQRETQERFQKMFMAANDAFLLTRPDGTILMANPAACRMFDRTEEEIILVGRNGVVDISDPRLESALERRARDGFASTELACIKKDGTKFQGEVTSSIFTDAQGQPCTSMIIRDVTERKMIENKLKLQGSALEAAANAIMLTNPEGSILWVNPAFVMLTGYSVEEVLGKTPRIFKSGEQDEIFYHQMWETILCGKVWRSELVNKRKDGIRYVEEISITPSLDESGNPKYFIAAIQDISKRKEFEKNFLLSESRYRNLFEESPIAIFEEDFSAIKDRLDILRREGITDWRDYFSTHPSLVREMAALVKVIRANKAAIEFHGLHSEEEFNQRFDSLFPDHVSKKFAEELIQIAQGKTHFSIDAVNRTFTGKTADIIIYFTVVPGFEKDYSKVIISVVDITHQKEIETELRRLNLELEDRVSQRTAELHSANISLAKASRLKDEFLANMSHELRTPLTGVLGLSETLQKGVYGPLNEKQISVIYTIEEGGRHLLNLINDILDLSKIEAGKAELQPSIMNVGDVCQSSLRMVRQMAVSKNLTVTFTQNPLEMIMYADPKRLKQILVNLLGNAVKFTPENGELGLEVCGDEDTDEVRFTVWDNGIGIAPENMEKLFQPFVQLDSGFSKNFKGTGLGLSLVERLTRLHGGRVEVQSELGCGSRFTVFIPWKKAMAVNLVDAAREKVAWSTDFQDGMKTQANPAVILIIDDNQTNNDMLADFLKFKGYQVITALDGRQGLDCVATGKPDVILMDIQMPGMDGLDAIRTIRGMPEGFSDIPIIALTALAMPEDRDRCLNAGADAYMSKPVDLNGLLAAIKKHLEKNK